MKIDKTLQDFLLKYVKKQMDDSYLQRWAVTRRVSKERALLKGDPTDWFNNATWRWCAASDLTGYNDQTAPRYNQHINIYSAAWQVLQAAIQTTGIPGSWFIAQNPKSENDRTSARDAKAITEYERSVLDYRALWMETFRYFYTDGLCLAYEHHVRDSARWGTMEITVPGMQQNDIPAGYGCPQCSQFIPSGQTQRTDSGIACPACEMPLNGSHFIDARTEQVPTSERKEIPSGRENIELFGALESLLPWESKNLDVALWAATRLEVAPELIYRAFPDMEGDLETADDSPENYREKWARMQAKSPLSGSWYPTGAVRPSYGRWWLRPDCFYAPDITNDAGVKKELLKLFPQGVFFQEANFKFLDAVPERMEDHLVLMKAFDSDGMYCPSLGQNGVPIQESVDTAWNLYQGAQEIAAYPPVLIDSEILSGIGMQNTQMVAGQYKECVVPPGKSLKESWAQINIKESSSTVNFILESYPQFMDYLVGISQALLGSAMTNTRSADQYQTARNQSLQRQAPLYESAKTGFVKLDEIIVHDFLLNRTDEEYREIVGAVPGIGSQELAYEIAPQRGRIFARAEESEAIPTTWAQKQAAVDALLASQNPLLQQSITSPANLELIYQAKGLSQFVVEGKAQRDKALDVIPQLLQSQPMPGQVDPQTGQPGPPQSSIPFDPLFDDAQIVLSIIKDWAASPEGIQERGNPNFENLRLYAQAAANAINPPKPPVTEQQLLADANTAVDTSLTDTQNPYQAGSIGAKVLQIAAKAQVQ